MKIIDVIATANRNLGRSKLRTFLTASAIFVGAFTLSLTTALGTGAQSYFERQLGNVTAPGVFFVGAKAPEGGISVISEEVQEYNAETAQAGGRITGLTEADIAKLRAVEGVESVDPAYQLAGEYIARGSDDVYKKYVAQSLTQNTGLKYDLAAGSLPSNSGTAQLILPEKYIQPLGFRDAQDAVGKQVTIGYKTLAQEPLHIDFTVSGVLKKTLLTEGAVIIDSRTAATIATAQGQSSRYFAAFAQFRNTAADQEAAQKQRIEAAGAYEATSFEEQISSITSVIGAITTALNVVGIIALVAASFGIINTLLMSVYERTQEIGLMKALGMHRRTVFALFAFEAMLVGFWGSVVAVTGAWLVSLGVNQWASSGFLKDFEGFSLLVVSPGNAGMVIGIIMLVAFLAGTLPAIKAARLNPIEALRSE